MKKNVTDFVISPQRTVLECLCQLDRTGFGFLVVIDDGKVAGVVSDGDVRRGLIRGCALEDDVAKIANTKPVVASQEMSRQDILKLSRTRNIDPIPIVSVAGALVDFVTRAELLEQQALSNFVVVMAGGKGVRLRPLTENMPKPLLPLAGRPIIEHIILHIASFGFRRFVISLNYLKQKFYETLGDGKSLGVEIEYVEETKRLGTIGALQLIERSRISEPLIVTNGDILTGLNFRELLARHEARQSAVTVCLKPYQQHVPYGTVILEQDRVVRLEEKPDYRHLISAGVYCLSPEALDVIPKGDYLDANRLIERHIETDRPVHGFEFQQYWRDIGSLEDYFMVQSEFARGIALGAGAG